MVENKNRNAHAGEEQLDSNSKRTQKAMTIEDVLAKLKKIRKSSKGWMALCPAHEDRNPSLSVSEGENGKVLLKCFAGCTFGQIADALGMTKRTGGCGDKPPRKRINWRKVANQFESKAEGYWLRGQKIIDDLNKVADVGKWGDEELDSALNQIQEAQMQFDKSEYFEKLAEKYRKVALKGGFHGTA